MLKIERSRRERPRLAIVYGEPGIGKTTLAARLGDALLIDLEDRAGHVDVDVVRVDSWLALRATIREIATADIKYPVIAIDTIDRAQDLATAWLCAERGWDTLDTPGYGRGYVELRAAMLALADDIMDVIAAGRGVLLLAHAQRQRVEDPVQGEWDRWSVRLHDAPRSSVAAVYVERADIVALAAMAVVRVGDRDARVQRARVSGRMLYTTPSAARLAKAVGVDAVDIPLDDAPAWLASALVPAAPAADQDPGRAAYARLERALGGREAVRALLRERGLSPRSMRAEDWIALAEGVEEVPE